MGTEAGLEDLEITGYLKSFKFDKILLRQEKLLTIFYFTFAMCRKNDFK